MNTLQHCPRCGRTADEYRLCGGADVMPCPPLVDTNPATAAVIDCRTCGKTRVIEVDDIMHSRTGNLASLCERSVCEGHILQPAPAPAPSLSDDVPFKEVIREVIPAAAQKRLDFLDALEAAGVDNWEGYSEAFTGEEDEEAEEEPAIVANKAKGKKAKPAPVEAAPVETTLEQPAEDKTGEETQD